MSSLPETLKAFDLYLQDKSNKQTFIDSIKAYDNYRHRFNREFYHTKLNTFTDLNDSLAGILDRLGVDGLKHDRFIDQPITVYELLVELNNVSNNNQDKLLEFIALADEHQTARWFFSVACSGLLSACLLIPFYLMELSAWQHLLSSTFIVAAAGLIYAVAVGIYSFQEYNTSNHQSFFDVFKNNLFLMARNVFAIAAWSLMLTAAVSNPIVSLLFIAAEVVVVIKETVNLIHLYGSEADSQGNPYAQVRSLVDREKQIRQVWIDLAFTVLMTLVIAAWCFVPGSSVVIALIATVAIAGLYCAKHIAQKENQRIVEIKREEMFDSIDTDGAPPKSSDTPRSEATTLSFFNTSRKNSFSSSSDTSSAKTVSFNAVTKPLGLLQDEHEDLVYSAEAQCH